MQSSSLQHFCNLIFLLCGLGMLGFLKFGTGFSARFYSSMMATHQPLNCTYCGDWALWQSFASVLQDWFAVDKRHTDMTMNGGSYHFAFYLFNLDSC